MNIKVNLQDGTPAQFKTEIIDGAIVVTVVEETKEEKNLFPKWEELGKVSGCYIESDCTIYCGRVFDAREDNQNIFSTSDLAKAALATARVSQTYRRYKELMSSECSYFVTWGLLRMTFKDKADYQLFYEINKDDLDLINNVATTVQL